eukprot:9634274-Alexandrium_andersonii.AAC.1
MSASLVGSEMCIRDSPWAPLGGLRLFARAWLPSGVDGQDASARRPGEKLCLLYTSDAADDM